MESDGRLSVPGQPRVARLFFALYPPDTVASRLCASLQATLQGSRGRLVACKNLHLTLAFLGELPLEQVQGLQAVALSVARACSGFELKLDKIGVWPRSGILWAACHEVPQELLQLRAELLNRLQQAGFPTPPGSTPFEPHVTLARNFSGLVPEPLMPPEVHWSCRKFSLVCSRLHAAGADYHSLASWPLESSS